MLAAHLLHELVGVRAQIQQLRRLNDYGRDHAGVNYVSVTDVSLDVAVRAITATIGDVTEWMQSQIIGLHDAAQTSALMAAHRERERERERGNFGD